MLFMVLPGLSRMIVFGVALTAYRSKEESSKGLFLVTRRGPIGTSETCG